MKKNEIGSGSSGSGLEDNIPLIHKNADKLTIVIPYLKDKAQGNELFFALRSMDRNFRENFQVVVIGDKEDWFSDEVIHIDAPVASENPQIDTLNKLKLAIVDENVSEKFIWSNDDIYFINPVQLADVQILTAQGRLKYIPDTKAIYEINRNKTIDCLKSFGSVGSIPTHNYDTHTPFFYDKEKLVSLFEEIPELSSEGLLIPSIYFNMYFFDHKPTQIDGVNGEYMLRIMSKNTDPVVFKKFIEGKKFLNNSEDGYNSLVVNYLETNFPEKSRFEI